MEEGELLRLESVCKYFPGVVANDHVDLHVRGGEIHALLGENGAGKTTLMNCLYGVYRPDAGRVYWKGEEVDIHTSKDAIALGIGMVHQHFMLVPPLSVAENVVLGLRQRRDPLLDLNRVEEEVVQLGKTYGLVVDPKALIWQLPVGVQQRVELVKVLYRKAELLILDEPTAVLTPGEVKELFQVLKQLTQQGLSIIFITHKLEEVMDVCDRVTVLRDGQVVGTVNKVDTDVHELARMMVGREVLLDIEMPAAETGDVVLKVQNLEVLSDKEIPALKKISFEIRRGEILGLAGVDGNGQTELAEALTGLRPVSAGQVQILGRDMTNAGPRELIELNVGHIPEDRQHTGLILDFTITENLVVEQFHSTPFSKAGFLRQKTIEEHAKRAIRKYDIRTPSAKIDVKALSGGNQQKVILARELSREPDLLVAMQPTRGLDVGATEYIRQQLVYQRGRGSAILLISTELEEIMTLSDRIAVLYEGEIMGIVPAGQANVHDMGLMMAGSKRIAPHPGSTGTAGR